MRDLLSPNVERVQSSVGSVFVYDGPLKKRAKIISRSIEGNEEVSASWVPLEEDDVYLEQLDFHRRGECFSVDINAIKTGIYKQQAEQSGIKFRFSCPIVGQTGSLFGYVSYGYGDRPASLSAKITEAKSSFLMKVPSAD